MTERAGKYWMAAALSLAALVAAGMFYWHRSRGPSTLTLSEVDSLRQAAAAGENRAAALENELRQLREEMAAAEKSFAEASRTQGGSRGLDPSAVAALQNQATREWQDKLAALENTLQQTKARVAELEASTDQVRVENAKLEESRKDIEERLTSTRRVVEAMEVELKGKTDRLTSFEIAANQNQEKRKEAERKLADLSSAVQQLEEINRRRDVYLGNILKRYREITDQYRAVVSRWDRSSEGGVTAGNELSRIQDAISLAEEDLRQLSALNARAGQMLRRLDRKP